MKHHIVFIDSRVNDIQSLIAGLGPNTRWVMVDANQDGIAQMQAALAGLSGLDSIQVVSHGSVGTLVLGTTVLNASSLGSYETQLKAIGTSLSATGDLMLYGCNVAQGDAGVKFMDALAQATGADVAASTGLTGLGGNWILEATSGAVEAAALNPIGYSATLDVITGGSGDNVLNGTPIADVLIGFAGNDTLDGAAGADTMNGGDGSDLYFVRDAGDVVEETNSAADGGGTDTVNSYLGSYTLTTFVENGFIKAAGAANLTGNGLANFLLGNASNDSLSGLGGNDTLDGGAGADTLIGGLGNDTFVVDDAGDVVIERNGEGTDIVESYLSSYMLTNDVENGRIMAPGVANLTGNNLANVLYSGDGDNVLDGGFDIDTVSYIYATSAVDVGLGRIGAQATGGSGFDTLVSVENLTGSNYADTLSGSTLDNILDGGAGIDTMSGGTGSDTYFVRDFGDVVIEFSSFTSATGGSDTVYSFLSTYTLGAHVENGRILVSGVANLTGNSLSNVLDAGVGDNTLDGSTGTDTASYAYATSAVTASLAVITAQVTGGSGSDTFRSIENLTGSSYDDTLSGSDIANVLDGGRGADTMTGGDGSDTYYVDNPGDVVIELAGDIYIDTVESYLGRYTLGANVENGRIGSSVTANLTGNSLNNVLYAGDGNNVLDGSTGTDRVSYEYARSAVTVSLAVSTAQATGGSGSDTLIGIESLSGSEFADALTGSAAANQLVGGGGADTMTGGDGSDSYYVSDAGTVVIETNATSGVGGYDTVYSYLSGYTLGANVENGAIMATEVANLFGNGLNNLIYAGGGDNVIDGSTGTDTVSYANARRGVTVSLNLITSQVTGGSGADTLTAIENLTGSFYGDTLTGNTGANTLDGGGGADTLNGGTGDDSMVGGLGNDVYTVDSVGDRVVETSTDALEIDRVSASVNWTLGSNVENLTLAGSATLGSGNTLGNVITGNALANTLNGVGGDDTLDGGDGADTLNGGAGNDSMTGGLGNDVYVVDSVLDVVVESSALITEMDRVSASVSWTLGANVENLTLSGVANLSGTGNALANLLQGNAGNNELSALGGTDTLTGGEGNDTLDGGTGSDQMVGGLGNDTYIVDAAGDKTVESSALLGEIDLIVSSVNRTLSTNVENLTLAGSATLGSGNTLGNVITGNALANTLNGVGGDDTLDGGDGADTLNGGAGNDSMIGGLGNDVYAVDSVLDVVVEGSTDSAEIDRVSASVSWTLGANVESLTQSGVGSISGTGNALANAMTGNTGANALDGAGGNDTISGGDGADTLTGGLGADRLTGGTGSDSFRFVTTADGSDTITDFASGTDKIYIVAANFGLTAGTGANLVINGTPSTGARAFVYSSTTGILGFDEDGSGAGAATQLATLSNKPVGFNSNDFVLGA